MIQFARFRLDAEAAIEEAFEFNGTLTDAHTKWIALEQARCVSTVEEFPELLEDACDANNSTVGEIRRMEEAKRDLRGTDRIHALQCIISDLSYLYIDLTVYARRSDQLNTLGERFRLTEEQLRWKRQTAVELEDMLSTECKTIFGANEQLVKDVKAKAEDLAKRGARNRQAQLLDGLLAELRARFVSLEDLMVPGVNSKECIDREESDWRQMKVLVGLLQAQREDCALPPVHALKDARPESSKKHGRSDCLPGVDKRAKTKHVR